MKNTQQKLLVGEHAQCFFSCAILIRVKCNNKRFIPWQLGPLKPMGHSQSNPPPKKCAMHRPPFWQGLGSHSSSSEDRRLMGLVYNVLLSVNLVWSGNTGVARLAVMPRHFSNHLSATGRIPSDGPDNKSVYLKNLPVQVSPLYPTAQRHTKPSADPMHFPPLWHGFGEQGACSVKSEK